MTKLTKGQIGALQAVAAGVCERRYSASGNTMHGSHARTLHSLAGQGLIEDERTPGPIRSIAPRFKLVLTDAGRSALAQSQSKDGRS